MKITMAGCSFDEKIAREGDRLLQDIAKSPSMSFTASTQTLRYMLLKSNGTMLIGSVKYRIDSKNLGAGVYKIILKAE